MNLTIIKKIAKQGKNKVMRNSPKANFRDAKGHGCPLSVLIIPKNLHPYFKEGELIKVQISSMPKEDHHDRS